MLDYLSQSKCPLIISQKGLVITHVTSGDTHQSKYSPKHLFITTQV